MSTNEMAWENPENKERTLEFHQTGLPLGLKCDKCHAIGLWPVIDFQKYFSDLPIKCPNCHKRIDLFDVYFGAVFEHFMFFDAFHCIGATSTTFSFTLQEGKSFMLDLSEKKIPKGAKVLNINYTATGGLLPTEMRGNNPLLEIDRNQPFAIFPIRFMPGPAENEVNAMVTWIANVDSAFDNLVSAYYAYSVGKFADSIIPANVAVEFSLNKFVSGVLSNFVSKQRVSEFLSNDATYGHQLNILLPYIVAMQCSPLKPLSDRIRGKLNLLRTKRNDVAHRGKEDVAQEKREVAECLVAALFGYIYIDLAGRLCSNSET